MTKRLHANARTTVEIRQTIRESSESQRVLARRYGINPKTVAKWKKRTSVHDLPTGPKPTKHKKLSDEEEEMIIALRVHTLLPLDDCLYSLQAGIPHLSRTTLHRCFQRHGISRLSDVIPAGVGGGNTGTVPIGCFHIDKIEICSAEDTYHFFFAIDQASKFVFARLARRDGGAQAAAFLETLVATIPFQVNTVLALDEGPFAANGGQTPFALLCQKVGIERRLATARHPWFRRQVERLNQMVQEKALFDSEEHLLESVREFVGTYNYHRRLKTLCGCTPQEFICQIWREEPDRFLRHPHHKIAGLEIMPG